MLTWDQTGDNDAFQSGRTIFAFNPLSIPAWVRDNKPEMLPGIGTYLIPEGPKMRVQGVSAVSMSVRADSPLRDKAKELLLFMYDREYYKEFWPKSQYGPTTEVHYDNEAFSQSWLKVRVDLAKNGKPDQLAGSSRTRRWAEVADVVRDPAHAPERDLRRKEARGGVHRGGGRDQHASTRSTSRADRWRPAPRR